MLILPTPETHGETGSVQPKQSQKATLKCQFFLFYVLKHCFLGSFWVDRPSLSVSFRSGQFRRDLVLSVIDLQFWDTDGLMARSIIKLCSKTKSARRKAYNSNKQQHRDKHVFLLYILSKVLEYFSGSH